MLRDWLLGKILLGAAALSILFVIGSFLWSQNEERKTLEQLAETSKNIRQLEERSKAQPIAVQQSTVKTEEPVEALSTVDNTTDPMPESENTPSLEETDIGAVSESVSLLEGTPIADTNDWRSGDYGESDYGFGAYPEIPSDYPEHLRPFWTTDADRTGHHEHLRPIELLARVRIKLWKQGQTDVKLDLEGPTQKIRIVTPGTVYVQYKETKLPNGTSKTVHFLGGSEDLTGNVQDQIRLGEKPAGIRVLDYDSTGFDVYDFLGINR